MSLPQKRPRYLRCGCVFQGVDTACILLLTEKVGHECLFKDRVGLDVYKEYTEILHFSTEHSARNGMQN